MRVLRTVGTVMPKRKTAVSPSPAPPHSSPCTGIGWWYGKAWSQVSGVRCGTHLSCLRGCTGCIASRPHCSLCGSRGCCERERGYLAAKGFGLGVAGGQSSVVVGCQHGPHGWTLVPLHPASPSSVTTPELSVLEKVEEGCCYFY